MSRVAYITVECEPLPHVVTPVAKLERLEKWLHANQLHPDWEYRSVSFKGGKFPDFLSEVEGEGRWILNNEVQEWSGRGWIQESRDVVFRRRRES